MSGSNKRPLRWWLGDFGSAVRVGTPIISTTRWFAPPIARPGAPAAPEFDRHMLAVAGVIEMLRSVDMFKQWKALLVSEADGCTPRENILATLTMLGSRITDAEAVELLQCLRKLVEPTEM